jgi:hypothetical protein
MSVDVHVPSNNNEKACQDCTHPATSVIKGNPLCDECVGKRIINGDFPEILGMLVAKSLRRD